MFLMGLRSGALYQGTTLVGTYELKEMGFSPCYGASRKNACEENSFRG